ncbi:Hpt domain-containing protein [Breoghania corrubedonensis]|uniref:Hpt domain-containing protein n=1 Tax=Breoghania corrubedonensis TaxID=665038 RepID=A0A2T5V4M6_9HYPH|nr:Hpt domain-containing protein [Breoghania corrubedonensis]PTW58704.1 Hpt domain-containing protein [Breoghania corrubedonensis]
MASSSLPLASETRQAAAPVDLVHLARHTFGNRELEHEVLRLFSCQSEIWMEKLKQAHDAAQRARAVHTIKGSARGIGAWQVADLAERLEADAQAMTDGLSGDLEDAISAANAFIRHLLNERA